MNQSSTIYGLQELNNDEIDQVSGGAAGKALSGGAAIAAAAKIGAVTFGSSWGAVGLAAAFGAAPIAVVGMGVLVAFGAYSLWNSF